MITRHFQKDDAASSAIYSDCETYRYALTRIWDSARPRLLFIMLNPSKATEQQNDPTIERCERRARALGFGGFRAVNIFALRETDPKKMRQHPAPAGPDNDAVVAESCLWADTILAAWGAHGDHQQRGFQMRDVLQSTGQDIHCLGLTKAGHPRHPLYIAYTQQPELWQLNTCQT
ncbi:DUF1643 domain-containing protein [Shimia marina]|uniref:DUF1643 domain-containing protein n=1 Tax=Shimia marina TaxID=321267 RepID=A0A0P1ETR4_9RHOB|nr:DUF1643 domain-containing protein [Shimia marina]CUH53858.1 hypothetical protein SHM7688_03327 [Shimia marina]SFE21062.1 hypothetical protein SAMN04488037_106184 [Shimia marina]